MPTSQEHTSNMKNPDKPLEIQVLPAKNRKKLALYIALVLLFSGLFLGVFGPYWGIFALLVLVGTTYNFYIPTKYRFDQYGITVTRFGLSHHRPWSQFKRVDRDKNGVFIGTFSKPSRLDPFRGIYIPITDREIQELILNFVKVKIAHD